LIIVFILIEFIGIQQVSATPTDCLRVIYKESVELTFVYPTEGCGMTLIAINDTIPHTRIDMGYWRHRMPQPQLSIRK